MTAFNYGDPRVPPNIWAKIQPVPFCGCWFWTGATNPKGYGNVKTGGMNRQAHRYVWRLLKGRYPRRVLDHRCRTRCCVNPAHLKDTTVRANTLAGEGPSAKAYHARKAREGKTTRRASSSGSAGTVPAAYGDLAG